MEKMSISLSKVIKIIENRTVYDDLDQPRWISWDSIFDDFEEMTGCTYKAFQMVDFYMSHGDKPEWLVQRY
jgi:hypothetical protein